MRKFTADKLSVSIYESREEAGIAAARDISFEISELLGKKSEINIIFAAAPSQNEVLEALRNDKSINWSKINAYHMDEYIGLDASAPQGFGNFLKERLFSRVPLKSVNYIDVSAPDPDEEAERYGALIEKNRPDLIVMGIGENGHIAFNDPPVADFSDKKLAKAVKLDEICRKQQVNDGCFEKLSDVPTHAITLTVPVFLSSPSLFCVVPAKTKAEAVRKTIYGNIGEHCPATALRIHDDARLYLDPDSASLL